MRLPQGSPADTLNAPKQHHQAKHQELQADDVADFDVFKGGMRTQIRGGVSEAVSGFVGEG